MFELIIGGFLFYFFMKWVFEEVYHPDSPTNGRGYGMNYSRSAHRCATCRNWTGERVFDMYNKGCQGYGVGWCALSQNQGTRRAHNSHCSYWDGIY